MKTCKNCKFYNEYYEKVIYRFFSLNSGICCLWDKVVKSSDGCERFKTRNFDKEIEEKLSDVALQKAEENIFAILSFLKD